MIGGDELWTDAAYADLLREAGLADVNSILRREDGDVCAWSRTTDTRRIGGRDGRPGFFLKRYYYPRWTNRLRGALRGTFFGRHRADAERALLCEMRSLGVPAVRPVACGARRVLHFVEASFLITEEAPGSRNLTTLAGEVSSGRTRLDGAQRRQMIDALAEAVGHMHAGGFAHGQLYWRNILAQLTPLGDAAFQFLDSRPRGGRRRLVQFRRARLEDLGHLLASAEAFTTRREQLRFLARYAAECGEEFKPEDLGVIGEVAQAKRAHEAQRIQMNGRFEAWRRRLAIEAAPESAS